VTLDLSRGSLKGTAHRVRSSLTSNRKAPVSRCRLPRVTDRAPLAGGGRQGAGIDLGAAACSGGLELRGSPDADQVDDDQCAVELTVTAALPAGSIQSADAGLRQRSPQIRRHQPAPSSCTGRCQRMDHGLRRPASELVKSTGTASRRRSRLLHCSTGQRGVPEEPLMHEHLIAG